MACALCCWCLNNNKSRPGFLAHRALCTQRANARKLTTLPKDWATATCNMYKHLVRIGRIVRELCVRTDRQTRSSQYSASLRRGRSYGVVPLAILTSIVLCCSWILWSPRCSLLTQTGISVTADCSLLHISRCIFAHRRLHTGRLRTAGQLTMLRLEQDDLSPVGKTHFRSIFILFPVSWPFIDDRTLTAN